MDTFPKVMAICFPNLKVHLNKTDYFYTFPNGSEIWLCGLDTKERAEKILGMEFSSEHFNEASEIDYKSVQIALSRLAEKNGLKKRVFYDFNPPKKTHWSYPLFIKGLDPIESIPLTNPEDYGYLLMNPSDNMENIDEDYLKILKAMPEEERNRFMLGLFTDSSDGEAYYNFDIDIHVGETGRSNGTLFIGMDFNVMPMTAVIGQFVNNIFYIHDEVFLENSDTYKMCAHLKKKGYIGNVIPDSTGKNRKTSGKSDFNILQESGFKIMPVLNPFVTDRVNNVNRLLQENRIIINPRCKKLINDLSKVTWKDEKLDQKGAAKMLTHISDALGYMCWKIDPISAIINQRSHSVRR